jgi:hypothetical protein
VSVPLVLKRHEHESCVEQTAIRGGCEVRYVTIAYIGKHDFVDLNFVKQKNNFNDGEVRIKTSTVCGTHLADLCEEPHPQQPFQAPHAANFIRYNQANDKNVPVMMQVFNRRFFRFDQCDKMTAVDTSSLFRQIWSQVLPTRSNQKYTL